MHAPSNLYKHTGAQIPVSKDQSTRRRFKASKTKNYRLAIARFDTNVIPL